MPCARTVKEVAGRSRQRERRIVWYVRPWNMCAHATTRAGGHTVQVHAMLIAERSSSMEIHLLGPLSLPHRRGLSAQQHCSSHQARTAVSRHASQPRRTTWTAAGRPAAAER
jgi:hypothetical protein